MSKKFRYPGVQPFSRAYHELFFGREEDSKELIRRIKLENLLVFYGKSGLGKTSLLNASVLPALETEDQYYPILMRFNNYDESTDLKPSDIFQQSIETMTGEVADLDAIPVPHVTLWQVLKKLQLSNERYAGGNFLLVFDQFEEFFTYPEGIEEFAGELSDLLNGRIPKDFRKNLRRALAVDEQLQAQLTEERKEKLLEPLNVKVVISIRSDRLSFLDQIKLQIPDVLKNTYELAPLSAMQAREAIVKPARLDGEFVSPKFEYAEKTLERIICFLQKDCNDGKKRKEPVESFQLQIICRHIESKIVEGEIKPIEGQIVVDPEDIDINLDSIMEAYYESEINRLSSEEQKAARELIEDGLILDDEQRRISLDRGVLKTRFPDVGGKLLKKLVGMHILRAEPNAFGSVSYELSHDTLVEPILRKKREREQEEKLRQEQLEKEREAEAKMQREKMRQRKILNRTILIAAILLIVVMGGGLFYLKKAYDQEAHARMQLDKANDSIKSLTKSRVGELQLTIREIEREMRHDSVRYAKNKQQLINERDEMINHRDTKIMELENRLENRNERIATLEQDVIEKSNKADSLQNIINGLNKRITRHKETISDLETKLAEKNNAIAQLEENLSDKKQELSAANESINKLSAENNRLSNRIDGYKSDIRELKQKKENIGKELQEVKDAKQKLDERVKELSSKKDEFEQRIKQLKTQSQGGE